jgi:hypothetical protein
VEEVRTIATHTKGHSKTEYIKTGIINFPLKHPKFICPDYDFDETFERVKMDGSRGIRKYIPQTLKRLLRAILR